MSKKNILIIMAVLVVVVLITGIIYVTSSQEVVASVNGEKITKEELYQELVQQNGQQTLDNLVTEKIITLEAKKNNVTVTNAEIDQKVNELKEEYGGEESFNMALQYNGITMDVLKKNIKLNIMVEKLIGPSINFTEEEMKQFFEEYKDYFAKEGQEPTFEDSKEKVRQQMLQQEIQAEVEPWLQEKKSGYNIMTFLK